LETGREDTTMPVVTGLFRDRHEALETLRKLQEAGFGPDTLLVVASPTSAGIAVQKAANALERPGDDFIDLGAALGGQADPHFPREERMTYEERVAGGDTLLRVETDDRERAAVALLILEEAGVERVAPGIIRD
jgi:hypothetical protein